MGDDRGAVLSPQPSQRQVPHPVTASPHPPLLNSFQQFGPQLNGYGRGLSRGTVERLVVKSIQCGIDTQREAGGPFWASKVGSTKSWKRSRDKINFWLGSKLGDVMVFSLRMRPLWCVHWSRNLVSEAVFGCGEKTQISMETSPKKICEGGAGVAATQLPGFLFALTVEDDGAAIWWASWHHPTVLVLPLCVYLTPTSSLLLTETSRSDVFTNASHSVCATAKCCVLPCPLGRLLNRIHCIKRKTILDLQK